MRAVEVSKYEGGKKVSDGRGIFHQWGCTFEEFSTGVGNYTTAIIEREDGSVQDVPAHLVKFIEPARLSIPVAA